MQNRQIKFLTRISLFILIFFFQGCMFANMSLFHDYTDPLDEYVLEGKDSGKILLISIDGIIKDDTEEDLLASKPNMIEEIVAQLKKAEKDKQVKGIVVKINSPGGTVTASDIIYKELMDYKTRTNSSIVISMMDIAASGGYYIALAGDYIMAHPTTITGSVGVIMMQPEISGLMTKLGLSVKACKSGENKDMGSPFRENTKEEQAMFQNITDGLAKQFINIVAERRKLDKNKIKEISTARIYIAEDALKIGIIDEIGYLKDAIAKAKKLAGLNQESKLVVYRRTEYPNDNIYNISNSYKNKKIPLADFGFLGYLRNLKSGFYYIWLGNDQ
ncbi:MAG: signal peptide peptidase SppA [Desulfobacterales bacterium]|nr:signal peptide peptidase SppA [Desulfobacterales bacterium]